jgi:signal transduction histidine kinase/CheY-like chemotaxis protein
MKKLNSRHSKKISLRNYTSIWVSCIILVVGLVATFSVSNFIRQEEIAQSKKEFDLVCNEIKTKIINRIDIQKEFLICSSSLFESSESVSREEWKRFNEFSIGNVRYRGVQGFGFSTLIKKEDLEKHVSAIRKEGFPGYTVFPIQKRDSYTSIIYLEPFGGRNALAFGYDMFSEPVRRKAMEEARDNNAPALSGKVFLLLKPKNSKVIGALMFVPVYKNAPINTVSERREAIIGWVFSGFRINDFIKSILGDRFLNDKTNIRLQIYDNDTISQKALLFDSQKSDLKTNNETKFRMQKLPVLFNGKRWTLLFSQPTENEFLFSTKILTITVGGIIISLLLSALSYSLLITKKRAKIIAKQLSLDLLVKNQEYEIMNESLNKNNKKLISSKNKLNKINIELEKAKVKAEESEKLKSAFLANMSHEIRTPMNGILGFTKLLKEENLNPEEQKNYIEIIEKSGNRLLSIINDIVDISKIEAGQMHVSHSKTNVDEQMQYIQTFFRPETQEKGIELILRKPMVEKETIISSDHEKLYAILINLVKNAIKYTVKGTIEFGYEIKGDYIEFFVKDTGIGISKDRQKAIFERFIQADYNDIMARQGTGLGLSIAKAYVELLGGKIWVESEIEKGSTFYFTIPFILQLEENKIAESPKPIQQVPTEVKNLKILVTEDDSISRMLILKVLKPFAQKILTAQTGVEAVEICRNNPDLDLILMDIQMPLMNGYEATKEIRKFNTAVIILAQTAFALEGDKLKTMEVGCNGYISKPIKKEELSVLLQHYFGNQQNLTS